MDGTGADYKMAIRDCYNMQFDNNHNKFNTLRSIPMIVRVIV